MQNKQAKISAILASILMLSFTPISFADSEEVKDPKKLTQEEQAALVEDVMTPDEIRDLRLNSIKEAVYAVSVQKAVNDRYAEIEKELMRQAKILDQTYNFDPFLMDNGKVLPPIISEAAEGVKLVDPELAVSSLTTYKIERPARIVSMSPNWRDYLLHEPLKIQRINPLLEPKNEIEEMAWADANMRGVEDGTKQANRLFQDGVARLTRDMTGAARFHRLVEQGIITKPVLATGKTAVDIDGETMTVGKTVYRLTEKSIYQSADKWKSRPVIDRSR